MDKRFQELIEHVKKTSTEHTLAVHFKVNKCKAKQFADSLRVYGLSDEVINVAIAYTEIRKGYLDISGVKAMLQFLAKKNVTDAESAIATIKLAVQKKKDAHSASS